jgi:hypothetical protein
VSSRRGFTTPEIYGALILGIAIAALVLARWYFQ